jgi:DNA polymerase elongation subunit (family B)
VEKGLVASFCSGIGDPSVPCGSGCRGSIIRDTVDLESKVHAGRRQQQLEQRLLKPRTVKFQGKGVEKERSRLAMELHDSVTQSIYGMKLLADAAQRFNRSGMNTSESETLRLLSETAHRALQEMRLLVYVSTLMVTRNISPETMLCNCCKHYPKVVVPQLGYHICSNRIGLLPVVLRPILFRRFCYKARSKNKNMIE